jgi:hypothetical protein
MIRRDSSALEVICLRLARGRAPRLGVLEVAMIKLSTGDFKKDINVHAEGGLSLIVPSNTYRVTDVERSKLDDCGGPVIHMAVSAE